MKIQINKGFSVIGLIVIIVSAAILILGGAYVYQNYSSKSQILTTKPQTNPNAQNSISKTITSPIMASVPEDWKIYTSKNYNFSIKYPPNMTADEYIGGDNFSYLQLGATDTNNKSLPQIIMTLSNSQQMCGDNIAGGIYGVHLNLAALSQKKLGNNTFDYLNATANAGYGPYKIVIYLQKEIPCKAIEVDMPTSATPDELNLVDTIMASIVNK